MSGMSHDDIALLDFDGSPMLSYLTQAETPQAREFLIEYYGEDVDGCYLYLLNDMPDRGFNRMDDGINCGLRGPNSYKVFDLTYAQTHIFVFVVVQKNTQYRKNLNSMCNSYMIMLWVCVVFTYK
jgi:hypothetical protein